MDNQLEPITLNTFNKMLEKDIAVTRDLENYLDVKYSVIDTCLTLANLCLDLETINPECAAYTKQRIQDYYTECEAKLNKAFTFHTPLSLSFDDLPKLKTQLTNIKAATADMLDLSRDAAAAIKRYPELLYTLHTMREKGVPTDDIDASIKNTEAELEEALASKTFPNECFKKFICNLNFYRIQVQKLEHWIYQKAGETSININPQTIQSLFADQMMKMWEKASEKGAAKALDKHAKKQRGPLRKSGAGKKPTFDTLDLQCKEFWNLYLENPTKDPHDYARKILNDPKWNEAKYKKDNPYLYTPNMTEEAKRTVRKNLIKRFITWCKTNGKGDPFPQK